MNFSALSRVQGGDSSWIRVLEDKLFAEGTAFRSRAARAPGSRVVRHGHFIWAESPPSPPWQRDGWLTPRSPSCRSPHKPSHARNSCI